MTVCNMSIEAGARAGMIAPDDTTYRVPRGPPARAAGRGVGRGRAALARAADRRRRAFRPRGQHRRRDARADDHLRHEPGHGHADRPTPCRVATTPSFRKALAYMQVEPASRCSASRSTSCSSAAAPTRASATCARRPGCSAAGTSRHRVRAAGRAGLAAGQAPGRSRGLDKIVHAAGAEWREPGCSMCIAHERRHGRRAASSASARATAISRAARAPARARCSRARSRPPRPPSTGAIADPRDCCTER